MVATAVAVAIPIPDPIPIPVAIPVAMAVEVAVLFTVAVARLLLVAAAVGHFAGDEGVGWGRRGEEVGFAGFSGLWGPGFIFSLFERVWGQVFSSFEKLLGPKYIVVFGRLSLLTLLAPLHKLFAKKMFEELCSTKKSSIS